MIKNISNYGQRVATDRAKELATPILNWFAPGELFLDFGCGIGHLGCHIAEETDQKITSLDIQKYPLSHPDLNVEIFDGNKIPYPDNTFDTSLIAYTLHHTKSPKAILKEVIRVTKNRLIISEDFLKTRKHIPIEVTKDILSNCFFAHITMQYKTVDEWENIFDELKLKIKERKFHKSGTGLLRFEHVSWLLNK